MKVVSTGGIYTLYDDSLQTYDVLPPQTYVVRFSQVRGFYLEKYVDIEITDDKIYGVHLSKVEKVLRTFVEFNRSLGVILSGDKGIGKSLFAKLLGIEAVNRGIPLIVADTFIPGIASYLESIDQEVMVLFDEFDKTFGGVEAEKGQASPQTGLLGLFDGVSGGKKLFVITCNNTYNLSEYLINRPGRFHYHFRFEYPSPSEIREYLVDKLPEDQYGEIEAVIAFSRKVNLNYDCLRAIAFEIGRGESFKSAITDLNILNTDHQRYNVVVRFKDGRSLSRRNYEMDLFDNDYEDISMYDEKGDYRADLMFETNNVLFDPKTYVYYIPIDKLSLRCGELDSGSTKSLIAAGVENVTITRHADKNLHYVV